MMEAQITRTEQVQINEAPIVAAAAEKASERVSNEMSTVTESIARRVDSVQTTTESNNARLEALDKAMLELQAKIQAIQAFGPLIDNTAEDLHLWATNRTVNSTQTGSQLNPIVVKSADQFKALLDSATYKTIHLGGGIYESYGYCQALGESHPSQTIMPRGCKIVGNGDTNIRLTPTYGASHRVIALANSHWAREYGSSAVENVHISLSDSVVQDGMSTEAVLLIGPKSTIRNVTFSNPVNDTHDNVALESFVIAIIDAPQWPANYALIENCGCLSTRLITTKNRQFSLCVINGQHSPALNPIIRNSRFGTSNSPGNQSHNAVTISGCIGGRIEGLYVNGPLVAVYQDCYSTDGLLIKDVEAHNCRAGVVLVNDGNLAYGVTGKQDWRNIRIQNAHIRLQASNSWSDSGIVVIGARTPHGASNTIKNVVVEQSTIMMESGHARWQNYAIVTAMGPACDKPVPGFVQQNNLIAPELLISIK